MDYLTADGRRSTYTPDFIVRESDGNYFVAETKGRADADVAAKARAAVEWCKAASSDKKVKWDYLFVPEKVFASAGGVSVEELARACRPSLALLLKQAASPQQTLNLEVSETERVAEHVKGFIEPTVLDLLPSRYRKAVTDAVAVFHFFEKKEAASFGPCFQPLLGPIDNAAEALLRARLESDVPPDAVAQRDFFEPDLSHLKGKRAEHMKDKATLLKKLLVHRSPLMPIGVLQFCLEYAAKADGASPGIFTSVRAKFASLAHTELPELVRGSYDFRNTYIAHAKADLTDREKAHAALTSWIATLVTLHRAVGDER